MSEEKTADSFYAVVLQSDGSFVTESFETAQQLADRLQTLINRDVSVSCFKGTRLHVSKPPMRYLITDDGNIPLFETDPVIEPDDTGYLGLDPTHLEDPPQLAVPTVGRPTPASDEFFSDDDEGAAINIFDNALPDPDS
jgi:hypothetical protein